MPIKSECGHKGKQWIITGRKLCATCMSKELKDLHVEVEELKTPNLFWNEDRGCDSVADLVEDMELGEMIDVGCAHSLPNRYYVVQLDEKREYRAPHEIPKADFVPNDVQRRLFVRCDCCEGEGTAPEDLFGPNGKIASKGDICPPCKGRGITRRLSDG